MPNRRRNNKPRVGGVSLSGIIEQLSVTPPGHPPNVHPSRGPVVVRPSLASGIEPARFSRAKATPFCSGRAGRVQEHKPSVRSLKAPKATFSPST
jgi:hypothetical protein